MGEELVVPEWEDCVPSSSHLIEGLGLGFGVPIATWLDITVFDIKCVEMQLS